MFVCVCVFSRGFGQVWNKLDNMNEQLAIKRSLQMQSLFGSAGSSKDLLNEEPDVIIFPPRSAVLHVPEHTYL